LINGAHGEVKIGDMGSSKMKLGKMLTTVYFFLIFKNRIGTPEFLAPVFFKI
jgi:WNK lysine deficient protein kinase